MDPMRCPYCVEDNDFKMMVPYWHGQQFVCLSCDHVANPTSLDFRCFCLNCSKPSAHEKM